ncbi:MAG: helix-turn-helix transcriptional regulator [Clostridia bacterium]|nr:helix-turn-helix transcriptional regulator [Clostridia bacterium]
MEFKNIGVLIREARIRANLTQEALAQLVAGLSAADLDRAECGHIILKQVHLRQIAKATGVTQTSLINAAKGSSSANRTAGKKRTSKKPPAMPEAQEIVQAAAGKSQSESVAPQSGILNQTSRNRSKAGKAQRIRFLKTPDISYRMALMRSRQSARRKNT